MVVICNTNLFVVSSNVVMIVSVIVILHECGACFTPVAYSIQIFTYHFGMTSYAEMFVQFVNLSFQLIVIFT